MNHWTFPNYLMIQTISGCNAGCFFCPYPYLKKDISQEKMDWELFRKIVDECAHFKTVKVIMPYLMNEPLLDRELPQRISYIKSKLPWVSIHILTNGSLLDQEFSTRLIQSGIDWVGFSLHGIESSTISSSMGIDFHRTLNNILNFIQLSRRACKDISKFVMITFINHAKLSEKEKKKVFEFWKKEGISRISYYSAAVSRAGNVPFLPKVRNQKIYDCSSIWTNEMLHILSNGEVVLCCMDWKKEVILGNVRENSIFEIWNGKKYQEVRKKIRGEQPAEKNFLCLRCECAQTSPLKLEKKVQLIITPPWGVEVPPLGLGVIAEALESKGYEVEVLDLNILLYSKVDTEDKLYWQMDNSLRWKDEKFISHLMQKYKDLFEEFRETLGKGRAKIVGFSVPTNCMNLMLKWAIEEIKKICPQKLIVLGGVSVSIEEQREEITRLLSDKLDLIVIGEGEETVVELASRAFENRSINDLGNVMIYQGGSLIKGIFNPLQSLSSPSPRYRKFNLNLYQIPESLGVEWSRGCIGKCTFCDFKVISKHYKKKSPQAILGELEFYLRNLGKRHFSIVDSSVNADLKWLEKICDLIIEKNLKIKLTALAIPRGDMSHRLLRKMKKAGFYRLEYGVESGSDKILKSMGKIFSSSDASRALRMTKKAGIKNVLYFITGYPGETEEDLEQTLQFIRENRDCIDLVKSVNPLYLMAGSQLASNLDKYRIKLPAQNPDIYWYIEGENNFEIRMERVKKIHQLLKELNIPYTTEATALPERSKLKRRRKPPDLVIATTPPWGVNNPPVGIAYLASYLRNLGFHPLIYDFNIEFYHSAERDLKNLWHVENKNFWSDPDWFRVLSEIFKNKIEEAVEKILESNAKIIGFSVVDPKERLTIELIKRIKQADKKRKIILGGPACLTAHSRKIFLDNLPQEIDYFAIGEGEEILAELLKKRGEGKVGGTLSRNNGEWSYSPRELIQDLDQIPFPTYEDFELSSYPGKSLILEWSRGCVGKCAFCINHELVRKYRFRSAEHIFQELKFHTQVNKIRKFTICDPVINGNPALLNKLCDLILKGGLDIEWTGEAIPRNDMDLELLKKMRRAGCSKLQIGLESGSNTVLRKMRKAYTAEIAENFIRRASLAGMETELFLLIGFPGEGEREFNQTLEFIKRNSSYIDTLKSINTLHLIAGTDVYNNPEKYNLKPLPPKNWHYLWETYDGNTYQVRRKRGEFLLQLAEELGLKVMETNLTEGKQQIGEKSPSYQNLKNMVNSLQPLPEKKGPCSGEYLLPRKRWLKLPYLLLILAVTLIAEAYLWILKKLRKMIIFPGS